MRRDVSALSTAVNPSITRSLHLVVALSALGISACAHRVAERAEKHEGWNRHLVAYDTQLAVRIDGAAPLTTLSGQSLLASKVSLLTPDQRLAIRTDYALQAGELLSPSDAARWRPGSVPQSLGAQRIGQQADLRLPAIAGAPVTLNLRHEQEERWLADAAIQHQRQGLGLQWAPSAAAFELQWQGQDAPVDGRQALACSLDSSVKVPVTLVATPMALRLGGRACEVVPLAASAAASPARTWSAGLQWGATPERRAALRLLRVDAQPLAASGPTFADAAAHELGLEHEERVGPWAARAGLAWRQFEAAAAPAAWASDASLSRDLGTMSVVAQWQSGDRYWFLPGTSTPTDDLALSLDFSRWAAQRWPGYTPTLSLAYRWQRAATDTGAAPAPTAHEDGSLEWRLSLPWR